MSLVCRNIKDLKYIFVNMAYVYMLTKLIFVSDFGLFRSKIISITFTIFIIKYL